MFIIKLWTMALSIRGGKNVRDDRNCIEKKKKLLQDDCSCSDYEASAVGNLRSGQGSNNNCDQIFLPPILAQHTRYIPDC